MRLRSHVLLFLSAVVAVSPYTASAHHAFAAEFDDSRTIAIQGTVTEFRLVNPHATIAMNVTDEAGRTTKWEIELAGRLNLAKGGWTPSTIRPGERVTVFGNPTHSGSPRLAFKRLVRPDGTELVPPGTQALEEIEQQRRERARQRSQQP